LEGETEIRELLRFLREHPRSVVYAVLAHLALLAVLVVSLDWSPAPSVARKPAPIQAVAIDARKLDAEVERKKKLEEARQLEKKRAEQASLKREQEKKQQAERKRKAVAEKKRKVEAEKKRKAMDVRKKAEAEKKRKVEAEQKRKAEQKKKAEAEKKRKADAEKKRKAAVEQKRKAEEARKKAEAEREMRERLAVEQENLRAQRDSAMQRMIDEYGLYIKEKVQRNWIRPSGNTAGLSCVVNVRLIPGGEVVDVKIVRGCGNAAFDRSVEAAVFKASPLPVPSDPEVMEKFRSITFEFNPDS